MGSQPYKTVSIVPFSQVLTHFRFSVSTAPNLATLLLVARLVLPLSSVDIALYSFLLPPASVRTPQCTRGSPPPSRERRPSCRVHQIRFRDISCIPSRRPVSHPPMRNTYAPRDRIDKQAFLRRLAALSCTPLLHLLCALHNPPNHIVRARLRHAVSQRLVAGCVAPAIRVSVL